MRRNMPTFLVIYSRVAISPAVTETLVKKGFNVNVEENAGLEAKFRNSDYQTAGAKLVEGKQAFTSGKVSNYTSQKHLLKVIFF